MAVEKEFILGEIRRIAAQNAGTPPGTKAFRSETGITSHAWSGRYWARWSDALIEAGFKPLEWNGARDEEVALESLIGLVRAFGKYPSSGDILLKKKDDRSILTPRSILRRFGHKASVVQALQNYCLSKGYEDVLTILKKESAVLGKTAEGVSDVSPTRDGSQAGYVYLAKSGRHYKIGRSNSHGRRMYELAIQLPEDLQQVHVIVAIDDPVGIERYWHDRFREKRLNGEWFNLSADEVRAFKKRKHM